MFGPPGHAYVYRSYGVHWCLNLVCEEEGDRRRGARSARSSPTARARADATSGAALDDPRLLCSGPGRLCQALGVTGEHDGLPLDRPPFELRAAARAAVEVATGAAHRDHARRRAALALRAGRLARSSAAPYPERDRRVPGAAATPGLRPLPDDLRARARARSA